jgi:A/G-specific adenine glycosylase
VHRGVCDLLSLLELPGLGDYSARAVLVFSCGTRLPLIDPNFRRVYTRYLGLSNISLADVEEVILKKVSDNIVEFYYGLLDFASLVCKDKNPDCANCCVSNKCEFNIAREA